VVLGLKPARLLEKIPVPDPSVVELCAVVGLLLVDQQIPLAVTAVPPSEVIFPPDTADVRVIELTAVVVSVGTWSARLVNETSLP
jgi:hypothetical protein